MDTREDYATKHRRHTLESAAFRTSASPPPLLAEHRPGLVGGNFMVDCNSSTVRVRVDGDTGVKRLSHLVWNNSFWARAHRRLTLVMLLQAMGAL